MHIIDVKRYSPITVETFQFPDGQPHIRLEEARLYKGQEIWISCRVTNPTELMNLAMVNDVIRAAHVSRIGVSLHYIMGGRMDRRIDERQPFTLKVVADVINGCGFDEVHTFDQHSDVTSALLNAKNHIPWPQVKGILESAELRDPVIVIPDAGAVKRTEDILRHIPDRKFDVAYCRKRRDVYTGALSGFSLMNPDILNYGRDCLIVDDICDGGGTFVGIADLLRANGANKIGLYVSHGIFSKGLPIKGIDKIWTTTSYRDEYPEEVSLLPFTF